MSVLRGFPPMSRRVAQIARKGRAQLADAAGAMLNGLVERITSSPAIGAAVRAYRYHDHGPEGGAPLPRGCIFSADVGSRDDNRDKILHTLLGSASWERMSDTYSMEFLFPVEVSQGIDSDSTNVSSNDCALRVELIVEVSAATAVDVRIYNHTTESSSSSDTTDGTTDIQILSITDVPCAGGETNRLDIEVQDTGGGTDILYILGVAVFETRAESQPASAGTTTYSSL